jgi:glycerol kinase
MNAQSKNPFTELRVDGGAAANNLMMQFQSDLLRIPVVRPKGIETTALGAAYLAGLAVGFWESPQAIWSTRDDDTRFEPKMPASEAEEARERWQAAVSRSMHWRKEQ